MNKVILLGNLTRDIELKHSQTGLAIGKTAIATNRRTKTQSGEQKNESMFIDLTIFGRTAEVVKQYFRKGSKILIEGRLSFDQWTDQNGMKRSKHSVIVENIEFVDSKGTNNSGGNYNQDQNNNFGNNNYQQNGGGNSNYQQQNSNYNNKQSAPQNQTPAFADNGFQQNSNNKPKEESVPTIDINEMDDQIPF